MRAALVPTVGDLTSLVGYVIAHPYLFVSSTTVMTTGLIALAGCLIAAGSATGRGRDILRTVAPPLALVLVYFGLGSLALATQILIRFHDAIPVETETQFASGLGHLFVSALGLALLAPHLGGRTAVEWTRAHAVALAYWYFHVLVLTPPWFSFQGQRELVTAIALATLGTATLITACCWGAMHRRELGKALQRRVTIELHSEPEWRSWETRRP
jgi:hypothetical protein